MNTITPVRTEVELKSQIEAIPHVLSPAELQQFISELSSGSINWFNRAYAAGTLDTILSALQQTGMSLAEAMADLALVTESAASKPVTPTHADCRGRSRREQWRDIRRVLHHREESEEHSAANLYMLHGATSHRAVCAFATDTIPYSCPIDEGRLSALGDLRDRAVQFLEKIADPDSLIDTPLIDELYIHMREIFGQHAEYLYSLDQSPLGRRLLLYTFMNWTSAVFQFHRDRRVWFTEIDTIRESAFRGGRIDGLEVVRIDGREPNEEEALRLRSLMMSLQQEAAHPTVGLLLQHISNVLRRDDGRVPDIELTVVEHKFDVGDNKKRRDALISWDELDEVSMVDAHQVEGYITLGNLSDGMLNDGQFDPHHPWAGRCRIVHGSIYYWLHPVGTALQIPVVLSPLDQAEFFWKYVVSQYGYGQRLARERVISKAVAAYLKTKLQGRSNGNGKSNGYESLMFTGTGIASVIEASRRFLPSSDGTESVFEERWHMGKGKPVRVLHLARYLRSIGIRTDKPVRAGMYRCPNHSDRTPSFEISEEGFHCWGRCSADVGRGYVDTAGVTLQGSGKARRMPSQKGPNEVLTIDDIVIPEHTVQILADAQVIMQDALRHNKAAQRYLESRGISLEDALRSGIGYCDGRVVMSRLSKRHGLEAITAAGIRVVGKHGPYCPLNNMITVPLEFERGKPTGIYGRSIRQIPASASPDERAAMRRRAHRKLAVAHEGYAVPHGIFNVSALQEDHPYIVVAEGVFDALSLMRLGYRNVVALIGADNRLLMDFIGRHTSHIALALDRDGTGTEKTGELAKFMRERGYTGKISNFTTAFFWSLRRHSDPRVRAIARRGVRTVKDYNELLMLLLGDNIDVRGS